MYIVDNKNFNNLLKKTIIEYIIYRLYSDFHAKITWPMIIRINELKDVLFLRKDLKLNKKYKLDLLQISQLNYIVNIFKNHNFWNSLDNINFDFYLDSNSRDVNSEIYDFFTLSKKYFFDKDIDRYNLLLNYILYIYNYFYKDKLDFEFYDYDYMSNLNNYNIYIDRLEDFFKFYIYWLSFNLFSEKKIELKSLLNNFNKCLVLDKDNPYFLLDYARLYGIHIFHINNRNNEDIIKAFNCLKKSFELLWKENINWYMYSWLWALYRHKKDYIKALYFIEKWISIDEKINIIYELSYIWKLWIYWDLLNYNKQISFWLKLENKNISLFRVFRTLWNAYINLWNEFKSKEYITKALDIKLRINPIKIIINDEKINFWFWEYYNIDNIFILNDYDELIYKIYFYYDKMIKLWSVHFIDLHYLEKVCYNYYIKFKL